MGRVLFVVAQRDFRDEELFDTKAELEHAGHTCIIASVAKGTCSGSRGRKTTAAFSLDDVDTGDLDAVVFVGGAGARVYFDDPKAFAIARGMYDAKKIVGAICIAPAILAGAGVLSNKKATAFETEVGALRSAGAHYQGPGVVVDGTVITASGPDEAVAFGKALARALHAPAKREARPD